MLCYSTHNENVKTPTQRTTPGIVNFDNFALETIDLVMGFSNRIIRVWRIAYMYILYMIRRIIIIKKFSVRF